MPEMDNEGTPGPPTLRIGKLCYVEIPAVDVHRSASFYESAFGWNIRFRDSDRPSFDDTTGEVSGAFVTGRPPATEPGLMLYVDRRCRGNAGGCQCRRWRGAAARRPLRERGACDLPRPGWETFSVSISNPAWRSEEGA